MSYQNKSKSTLGFSYVIFASYVLLMAILVYHHEPWGDEADAWLIVRDRSLDEIFTLMGPMGSPSLWYLIQYPFAKLGFAYSTQAFLHLTIALSAAFVFFFYSPFSLLLRSLFLFGYFMGYEYSIVARNYSLSVLLLFSIAALDPLRHKKHLLFGFLLALLANTNVHSIFISCAIFSYFAIEQVGFRRKPTLGLLVAATGILLALIQVWPPENSQMPGFFSHFKIEMLPRAIINAFLPHLAHLRWQVFWFSFLTLAFFSGGLIAKPRALFVVTGTTLALSYLFVFKYAGGVRHAGFILLVLLYSLWISRKIPNVEWGKIIPAWPTLFQRKRMTRLGYYFLTVSFLVSSVQAIRFWNFDLRNNFSDAMQMAQFLISRKLDKRIIAANPPFPAEAILPHIENLQFWYPGYSAFKTHMTWDNTYVQAMGLSNHLALERVKRNFPNWNHSTEGVLILLNKPMKNPHEVGYTLLFKTDGVAFLHHENDQFFLYEPIPLRQDFG